MKERQTGILETSLRGMARKVTSMIPGHAERQHRRIRRIYKNTLHSVVDGLAESQGWNPVKDPQTGAIIKPGCKDAIFDAFHAAFEEAYNPTK